MLIKYPSTLSSFIDAKKSDDKLIKKNFLIDFFKKNIKRKIR